MKTTLDNNKEIFNEITVLLLSYLILSFTEAVGDPETRSIYGRIFIFICILNVFVHLIFLLLDTIGNIVELVKKMKKKCQKKKNKKVLKIGLKVEKKKLNK